MSYLVAEKIYFPAGTKNDNGRLTGHMYWYAIIHLLYRRLAGED